MAVLTTRSSWTPSVVMILVVIISFSNFDVLNAKKSPAHSPSHSSAPSSAPVPVPVSPSAPAPGPGPVTPTVPGPAPGPSGPNCVNLLSIAYDCIDYLAPGNTSSDPGAACCNETKQVLNIEGGEYCLCELLANPDTSPLPVSVTQAWMLPKRCGISGSPAVLCSLIGVHITTPPGIASTTSLPAPEPSVSSAPTVNPSSPPPPPPSGASATSIGLFTLAFSIASVLSLLSSHMFF